MNAQKPSRSFRSFKAARIAAVVLAVCLAVPLIFALTSMRVFAAPVGINEASFPDAAFRAYVSENFDADKDGVLSESEAVAATSITITSKGCTSLEGIGYFPELQELDCRSNQLASLDLSANPALRILYCGSNQLTSLDLSSNPALSGLDCLDNQLASLDLSSNPALEALLCAGNQLTSLDLSSNPALETLICSFNQFTSLDLSANPALRMLLCNNNQLTSLDVGSNPALMHLACENNQLTSLDVGNNPELTRLYCYSNQLTSLDVGSNPALWYLDCSNNHLFDVTGMPSDSSVNVDADGQTLTVPVQAIAGRPGAYQSDVAYPLSGTHELKELSGPSGYQGTTAYDTATGWFTTDAIYSPFSFTVATDGQGTRTVASGQVTFVLQGVEINEANFPDAAFRAYVSENFDADKDGELAGTEAAAVTSIDVRSLGCTSLEGIGYFPALRGLGCFDNQLTSLDLSANPALGTLLCHNNQLTSLDLGANPALRVIFCNNNQLTSLDVGSNPALAWFDCSGNQLTSLDVGSNPALTSLYCSDNQLTSLDVGSNPELQDLNCSGNQLTSLDLGANPALRYPYYSDNHLFDITGLRPGASAISVGGQTIVIPVQAVPGSPGAYQSDVAYPLSGTHALKELSGPSGYQGTTAYDAATGRFTTDLLDEPFSFTVATDGQGTRTVASGQVTFVLQGVEINEANFPDAAFRAYVSENFDADKDGVLADAEASAVTRINVAYLGCASLEGIGYFSELLKLYCFYNQLTSLDLSNNPALDSLYCSNNQLTSLDVGNNPVLTRLNCSYNQLTSLDLSANPALVALDCSDNHLFDITGLQLGVSAISVDEQTIVIPVQAVPGSPGAYLSDAAYLLSGTHTLKELDGPSGYQSTTAYDAAIGQFTTDTLDEPFSFTVTADAQGSDAVASGQITFVLQGGPPVTYTVSYVPGAHGSGIVPSITVNASETHTVIANAFAPNPGYTFDGWDATGAVTGTYTPGDAITVTGDITLTARWAAIPTYTVDFVDFDGTTLKSQTVVSGEAATAPADPVRQGYEFTGWDKPFDNVTSDLTVTATYTPIAPVTYTVTFVDHDGTVLKEQTVVEGEDAIPPANPVRSGYMFISWDKAFTNVTSNITVTAVYALVGPITYTVTYAPGVHGSGVMLGAALDALDTHTVEQNEFVPNPGWVFDGWNATGALTGSYAPGDIITVTGNITLTARWAAIPTYTVTFVDFDGSVIKEQTVISGAAATAPADPVRPGYTFTGWDKAFDNITADTTVTATYTPVPPVTYKVKFVDFNGTVLKEQIVDEGTDATAPADPVRAGYTFTGWDTAFTNVTADLTVTATYTALPPVTYTVTYAPGTHGSGIVPSVTVNALDAHTVAQNEFVPDPGYTFDGWDATSAVTGSYVSGDTITVTGNITLTARWKAIPTFTVTFKDHDGATLKEQTVISGEAATAPADPVRPGYTFTGWDKTFDNITSDTTVTATYTPVPPVTYKVKFVDFNGTVLKEQTVDEGTDATAPADPVRAGYTFTGWDTAFTNVTADLTVTATYTAVPPVTYKVKFVDFNGSVLKEQDVTEGTGATAPADPVRQGYTFTGWDKSFISITSDTTVTATYAAVPPAPVSYTVTFKDTSGAVLKTESVPAGGSATPPQAPVRQGYTFTGWDGPLTNITSDTTFVATYVPASTSSNTFTVTFSPGAHGAFAPQVTSGLPSGIETPSAPQPTAAPGYSFTGWYPAVNTTVTGDVTYTAQWTQLPSSTPVQPQVIIRPAVPGADTYVTVTPPTPQVPEAQGQGSTTAQDSSAGSGAGAGSNSGSGSTTGLSDDKTPLSDGSTESTAAPTTDLGFLLLLFLFLIIIIVVGWLLLRYAKY